MNENQHLISIIIPVYNAEKYLKKCINSVINQSYDHLEIILVNDGSTDHSLNICEQFSQMDKRIKIINQENSGPSKAKNAGILVAQGAFMAFFDADDYIDKDMVFKLHKQMIEQKGDLIICGYNRICGMSKNKHIVPVYFKNKIYQGQISSTDFVKLYRIPMLNQNWNKLYDSNIIKSNHIFFEPHLSLGEDLIFNLEVLKNCNKIILIDACLYNYVFYSTNSLSKRYRDDFFDIQERLFYLVKQYILDAYPQSYHESIKELENYYTQIILNIIITIARTKHIEFKKRYEDIWRIVNNDEVQEIVKKVKIKNYKMDFILRLIKLKWVYSILIIVKFKP